MDRRTKLILLIIGSVILLGSVLWFFVWPLLQPEIQRATSPQPPALGEPNPPSNPSTSPAQNTQPTTFDPSNVNPDLLQIQAMSRRASVLAERIESGASEQGFRNMNDATLDAAPELVTALEAKRKAAVELHPVAGKPYSTIARALVALPEGEVLQNDTFHIRVQLQVRTNDNGAASVGYLESTVTYKREGAEWLAVGYEAKPYTP